MCFLKLHFMITVFNLSFKLLRVKRQLCCCSEKKLTPCSYTDETFEEPLSTNKHTAYARTSTYLGATYPDSIKRLHAFGIIRSLWREHKHTKRKQTVLHATIPTPTTLQRCREATDCFQRQASASLHSSAWPPRN